MMNGFHGIFLPPNYFFPPPLPGPATHLLCLQLHTAAVTLQGVDRFAARPATDQMAAIIHYAIGDSALNLRVGQHPTRAGPPDWGTT